MPGIVSEFVDRLDDVLAWDKKAVESSTKIKKKLEFLSFTLRVVMHMWTLLRHEEDAGASKAELPRRAWEL